MAATTHKATAQLCAPFWSGRISCALDDHDGFSFRSIGQEALEPPSIVSEFVPKQFRASGLMKKMSRLGRNSAWLGIRHQVRTDATAIHDIGEGYADSIHTPTLASARHNNAIRRH